MFDVFLGRLTFAGGVDKGPDIRLRTVWKPARSEFAC